MVVCCLWIQFGGILLRSICYMYGCAYLNCDSNHSFKKAVQTTPMERKKRVFFSYLIDLIHKNKLFRTQYFMLLRHITYIPGLVSLSYTPTLRNAIIL